MAKKTAGFIANRVQRHTGPASRQGSRASTAQDLPYCVFALPTHASFAAASRVSSIYSLCDSVQKA
jgi:hypothetical protein